MKRLSIVTLVLIVMSVSLTGCRSDSRFCLRNICMRRGAVCDPCAPPCAPVCEPVCEPGCGPGYGPGYGAVVNPGMTMESTTVPLPQGNPTLTPMMPGN